MLSILFVNIIDTIFDPIHIGHRELAKHNRLVMLLKGCQRDSDNNTNVMPFQAGPTCIPAPIYFIVVLISVFYHFNHFASRVNARFDKCNSSYLVIFEMK